MLVPLTQKPGSTFTPVVSFASFSWPCFLFITNHYIFLFHLMQNIIESLISSGSSSRDPSVLSSTPLPKTGVPHADKVVLKSLG